jgi:hypothetical protein
VIKEYVLPDSAERAVAELGGGVIMAGGTTVMPAVHAGALGAERVVASRAPDSRAWIRPASAR